jgi:hypothetical protein
MLPHRSEKLRTYHIERAGGSCFDATDQPRGEISRVDDLHGRFGESLWHDEIGLLGDEIDPVRKPVGRIERARNDAGANDESAAESLSGAFGFRF